MIPGKRHAGPRGGARAGWVPGVDLQQPVAVWLKPKPTFVIYQF